jgi:hypothetical protein
MPRYIIERQYLLPVYQHLALDALDLEAACREALDDGEHDWEDAQEDYEDSRPTTIVSAIEIANEAEWATATKSQYLANSPKQIVKPSSRKSSNAMTAARGAC